MYLWQKVQQNWRGQNINSMKFLFVVSLFPPKILKLKQLGVKKSDHIADL